MKKVISYTYSNLNIPRKICNHIIGKEHKEHHRITVGLVVMIVGVVIAKAPISGVFVVHVILETGGFLLHCIGAIPIVQRIEKLYKNEQQQDK